MEPTGTHWDIFEILPGILGIHWDSTGKGGSVISTASASAISNHPDPLPFREGPPILGPALVPHKMNFTVHIWCAWDNQLFLFK